MRRVHNFVSIDRSMAEIFKWDVILPPVFKTSFMVKMTDNESIKKLFNFCAIFTSIH